MLSFKPDNREPIFFLGAGAEVFFYWLITAPSKAVKANDENNLSQEMEPEGFQTSATLGIGLVGQGLLVRAIWLRWLLPFCVHLPSGTLSRLWHNKKMFLPKVLAATCTSFYMLQYHLSDECVGVPVAAVPAADVQDVGWWELVCRLPLLLLLLLRRGGGRLLLNRQSANGRPFLSIKYRYFLTPRFMRSLK